MRSAIVLMALMTFGGSVEMGAETASQVMLETSMGNIVIALNAEVAPESVENFVEYVEAGFYDGTIFHRVIDGFMIQGGGFTGEMSKKATRDPIVNEADNGLRNSRGTVAMARTADPHSATAQFFINTADNAFLDHQGKNPQGWGYAVFGQVIDGLDVVDAIGKVETGRQGMFSDVPMEPVVIQRASVLQ